MILWVAKPTDHKNKKLERVEVISGYCCLLYFTDGSFMEAYKEKPNPSYVILPIKLEPPMLKFVTEYWD
jgi:hypothetical protein